MRLFIVFTWLCFLGVLGMAAIACSSDPPATHEQTAGQGGDFATGTGGATGAAGASSSDSGAGVTPDGATGAADTPESVCRAAVTAQCQRRIDCGQGISLACFGYVNLCPEYYFGPGSNRTVPGVRSCVAAIEKLSCSDLAVSALPACLIGGARAMGAGCAYGSQCLSTYCQGGSQQCGTCGDIGQLGKSCPTADCEPGAFCNPATKLCESVSTIAHGAEGAQCNQNTSPILGCAGDLVCAIAQGSTTGICTALPAEGKACTGLGGVACASELVCVRNADGSGTCRSLAACGVTACDASSYCNYSLTPPSCAPRATEGKPCVLSGDTGQVPCIDGTTCTPLAAGGMQGACIKPGNARTVVCTDSTTCPFPLRCVGGHCGPLDPTSCGN